MCGLQVLKPLSDILFWPNFKCIALETLQSYTRSTVPDWTTQILNIKELFIKFSQRIGNMGAVIRFIYIYIYNLWHYHMYLEKCSMMLNFNVYITTNKYTRTHAGDIICWLKGHRSPYESTKNMAPNHLELSGIHCKSLDYRKTDEIPGMTESFETF